MPRQFSILGSSTFRPTPLAGPGTKLLQMLKMVGPLPFATFSKCRLRPLGAATAKGAGSPPPRPPNETLQTLKMVRSPPGAMFVFKVLSPAEGGGDPTPTAKLGTPPRRVSPESAVGARPRGRRAGPRREGGRHRTLHVVSCFPVCLTVVFRSRFGPQSFAHAGAERRS